MKTLAVTAALCLLAPLDVSEAKEALIDPVDAALDFCKLTRTFTEDFNDLSVAARDIGSARWIAHTPWNGDFGDAAFMDPGLNFPFTVRNGMLSIRARKDRHGKWRSGLLASADGNTKGFAQQYGYFEAKAKLPHGPGVWPAFWLGTSEPRDRKEPGIEIDVLEYYGHAPASFQSGFHIWHKPDNRSDSKLKKNDVPKGSLTSAFHIYGVKVTPKTITYYLDRDPVWQIETPEEHKMPLLLMVNLAAGSGFPIDKMHNPSIMKVDYVRAYALGPDSGRIGCFAAQQ